MVERRSLDKFEPTGKIRKPTETTSELSYLDMKVKTEKCKLGNHKAYISADDTILDLEESKKPAYYNLLDTTNTVNSAALLS